MEQFIKEAIGLGSPQIQPEPQPQPDPKPTVTIYDFGRLLSENEPDKKQE
ncbi:hypothetical protein [Nostoc sp. GT001]|nr:hypothetical protein [Nostoc sp. GT001]MDM9583146.1 hypothetical protein [Nostoc sp. GT001]